MEVVALYAYFKRGQIYPRRQIHNMIGGQEQGGISTPKNVPLILLFSTQQRRYYTYYGGWKSDGFYHYFGEGQTGDMRMIRGNRAIRDHQKEGKTLMLFEGVEPGMYRFQDFMTCADYYQKDTDTLGNKRKVFIFRLAVAESIRFSELPEQSGIATIFIDLRPRLLSLISSPIDDSVHKKDLLISRHLLSEQNRRSKHRHVQIPLMQNVNRTKGVVAKMSDYKENHRDVYQHQIEILHTYVLERANGFCESCGKPAPFTARNGSPYLEVHYIGSLSDFGIRDPNSLIALCPKCHAEAHCIFQDDTMLTKFFATSTNIENSLDNNRLKLVCAAIIQNQEGKILLAQRQFGDFAGYWELPKGQLKKGETLKQCISREIFEEFRLEIREVKPFLKVDYEYGKFYIRHFVFTCKAEGNVVLQEHAKICWLEPKALEALKWLPADEEIVQELMKIQNVVANK